MEKNTKLSFKLMLLTLVDMARPAQSTEYNKSFQYLKKEGWNEVDFLCN